MRHWFILIPLAVNACASSRDSYPSLAPRAIEKRSDAEPVPVVATAAPDPALDRMIAAEHAALEAAKAKFAAQRAKAEALAKAAAGASAGSDAWLDAHAALARLDAARAAGSDPLTELNRLAMERARDGLVPYPALEAARTDAAAQEAEQDEAIARIAAALAPA